MIAWKMYLALSVLWENSCKSRDKSKMSTPLLMFFPTVRQTVGSQIRLIMTLFPMQIYLMSFMFGTKELSPLRF